MAVISGASGRMAIPASPRGRLLLAMDASGLTSGQIQKLTGYSSQRIAGYTSGRNTPRPDTVAVLGKLMGFNALWLYQSNLDSGTSRRLKNAILKLLENGWKEPPVHNKRGRPKKNKTTH